MTIWGAEFDETGTVSHLYYADNNDYFQFEVTGGSTEYQHHRILRKSVRYNDGGDLRPIFLGEGSEAITDVGKISLCRDKWKQWAQSLGK